jgi:uncharacterized protein (TIGR03067 family)
VKSTLRVSLVSLGAVIVLLGPVESLVAQPSAVETERQRLQGSWELVSGEMDGKSLPADYVHRSQITFVGNTITLETPHQSREPIVASFARLDPTKAPREMHWIRTAGPNPRATMTAIYEFRGDDEYRICFDPAGRRPPTELVSKEGTGHICHTWRRMKP